MLLTDRYDSSGNLRTWDCIDERPTRLAAPGLRVQFTEIPTHQTRGVIPDERIVGTDCRLTTTLITVWEEMIIVRLAGPVSPRNLSVRVRTAPSNGAWRLNAWDVDGDDTTNQGSAS